MRKLETKQSSCILANYTTELRGRIEGQFAKKNMLTHQGKSSCSFDLYYQFILSISEKSYEFKLFRNKSDKYKFRISISNNNDLAIDREYVVQEKERAFTYILWGALSDIDIQLENKGMDKLNEEQKRDIIENLIEYMWLNS